MEDEWECHENMATLVFTGGEKATQGDLAHTAPQTT